ncbi:MAG: protein kinase [Planctomycetes bacterium]|nr:protein kinase [Planctomycetota bacterium]
MRTCVHCRRELGQAFAQSPFCPCCHGRIDGGGPTTPAGANPYDEERPPLSEVLALIAARAEVEAPAASTSSSAVAAGPTQAAFVKESKTPSAEMTAEDRRRNDATAIFDPATLEALRNSGSKDNLDPVPASRVARSTPTPPDSLAVLPPSYAPPATPVPSQDPVPSRSPDVPPADSYLATQQFSSPDHTRDDSRKTVDRAPVDGGTRNGVEPAITPHPSLQRKSGTVTGSADERSTLQSGQSLEEAPELVVNRRLVEFSGSSTLAEADYQLIDTIGEGGIGVVYAARQAAIDRTVAVKMLRSQDADTQQRGKFLAEAVITGELDHPNIVPIYDLGANQKGALFYSMKRVRGTPWNKVIREKSLPENLEILMKVADAVAFAHSRHVVHRDLKPENVMLGDFGEVLLMDWGLAVAGVGGKGRKAPTHDPGMGGTPAYMSPEMAVGPLERIDARSDVYLLGAILFEIVTGKPPHTGPNVMGCLFAAARNEIVPTDHDGELIAIARVAMSTERNDRHQSVKDFQAAVRDYQSHAESVLLASRASELLAEARRTNAYDHFAQAVFGYQQAIDLWPGNHAAQAGAVVARMEYAAAAIDKTDVDLALSLIDGGDPRQQPIYQRAVAAQKERNQRQQRLAAAKRMAVALAALVVAVGVFAYVQISRDRDRARDAETAALDQQKVADAARAEAQAAAERAEANAKAASLAKLEADAAAEREKAKAEEARLARIAADQDRIAADNARKVASYEAYVARIGLAAAKIEENSFGSALQLLEACEPERRRWEWGRLAYLCGRQLRDFDAAAPVDGIALSPDGKRVAAAAWGREALIWHLAGDQPVVRLSYGSSFVHGVAFSPDGRQLAVCGGDPQGYVQLFDVTTGAITRTLVGHEDGALGAVYSRDGSKLLTCSYDRTARLWDVHTGAELKRFEGHNWWVWSAQFAPAAAGEAETRIVTASQDGTALVWDIATGEASPPFRGHDGPIFAAAFSPDGRRVATAGADKRILLWDPAKLEPFDFEALANDREPKKPVFEALSGHTSSVRSIAFSADGARLVSGAHDNTVRLWDVASRQSVKTLRGHAGWVRAALFTAGDKQVVSASHDRRVMLWDLDKYEEQRVIGRRVLQGHSDAILAAAFSPDDGSLVTAGRDHTAQLWDVAAGKNVGQFSEGHSFLASQALFFPPTVAADGTSLPARVATAGVDDTVRIWDAARGVEMARFEPAGRAAAVAVSHDGRRILSGAENDGATLWDVASGKPLHRLPPQGDEVVWTAFSADDTLLFTGEAGGACRLWNAADGKLVRTLNSHRDRITGAVFLADRATLLTASGDNTVVQWNIATGEELTGRGLVHPAAVTSLAVDAVGRIALTGSSDGKIRLWELATGRELTVVHSAAEPVRVDLSRDGRWAIGVESVRGVVRVWDLRNGTERRPLPRDGREPAEGEPLLDLAGRGDQVWSAKFSTDAERILTVGGDGAKLWDVATGEELQDYHPHGAIAAVAYSPDGTRLATGSWDHSIKIWDAASRRAVIKISGVHTGNVNSVDFSSDGRLILSASDDKTCRVCSVADGRPTRVVLKHEAAVITARFNADASKIITGAADGRVRLWNAADGRPLLEVAAHGWAVSSAVVSPDGKLLASGSGDNTAAIFNAETGALIHRLEGHTAGVSSVAFTHDGARLLTGARDNLAKVWDVAGGKELLTLKGHTEEITCVAFSHDDGWAVTAGRDGTAVLWPALDWTGSAGAERLAPDAKTSDNSASSPQAK